MKKILIISGVLILLSSLTACNIETPDPDYIPGEIDLHDPILLDSEEPVVDDLDENFTFKKLIVGQRLEGKSTGELPFPYYFTFSINGDVEMYEKPFDNQDWELVQEFKVTQGKVQTNQADISDILNWEDILKLNTHGEIIDNNKEGEDFDINKVDTNDGLELTLYPEGSPIGGDGPFNLKMSISPSGETIIIDFLNHNILIQK